jgi:hypothetical protein
MRTRQVRVNFGSLTAIIFFFILLLLLLLLLFDIELDIIRAIVGR